MVWVLSTVPTSLDPVSSVWYLTGPATVGRTAKGIDAKQPDIVVNDVSVSKVHISLSLDTKEGAVSTLFVKDHSRYGTFIDGVKLASGSRELHNGSLIKLSNKISLSVIEEPFILLTAPHSTLPASDHALVQQLGSLTVKWSTSATHALVYPQQQAWAGLLAAVLMGLPIVSPLWLPECFSQPVWPSSLPDCRLHAAPDQIPLPASASNHGQNEQQPHPYTNHPTHFQISTLAAADRAALHGITFQLIGNDKETKALAFCIQKLGGTSTPMESEDRQQHIHMPGVVVVCEECAGAHEVGAITPCQLLVAIATCNWRYLAGVAAAAVQAAIDKAAAAAAAMVGPVVISEDMTEEEEEENVEGSPVVENSAHGAVTSAAPPCLAAVNSQDGNNSAASHKRSAAVADGKEAEDPTVTPGQKRRRGDAAADTGTPWTCTHSTPAPSETHTSAIHPSVVNHTTTSTAPPPAEVASPGRSTKAWRMANRAAQGTKQSSSLQSDVIAPQQQLHQSAQQQQQPRQLQQQTQQQSRPIQPQPTQPQPKQAQPSQKKQQDFMAAPAHTNTNTGSDDPLIKVHHIYESVAMVMDPARPTPRAGSRGSTRSGGSVVDYSPFRKVSSSCGGWATATQHVPLVLESVDQFRAHEDNDEYHRADQARKKLGKQADVLFQTTQGANKRPR